MASSPPGSAPLRHTPLHSRHVALGARMVPFAGYDMPVQYAKGIIAEHQHTRKAAGLFDVSHMGQAALAGPDHATVARALEALVPADILGLVPGQQRYSQLLNDQGGIIDDLMVTRPADGDGRLLLVVNAACKDADIRHIRHHLPDEVRLEVFDGRALLALQGPEAEAVLARHAPEAKSLAFMSAAAMTVAGIPCHVSRSGYTGEDGYEISVPGDRAGALWDLLMAEPEVEPIGLGARDSLRLEAGLCLYGHDINEETSPVEAALAWSIQRRRRQEGGFPGSHRIMEELADGPLRKRVGLLPEGRMPAREGTEIKDAAGELVGEVTSGGFGPTLGAPVAMGYVASDFAREGTALTLVVRGKEIPARVVPMPFVAHRYKR
ncbi:MULTISPECIES: glycine cleavage system aminomethyltransferase GcvT [unclassified Chelatococcus]|uniref:glycine cleavage system aminomethyltransferase GcvT n=1 Tax=unclassified Chelatococcus TaxID=2638111 RepID=UPI00037CFEA6|nr:MULTISPECIES: glycine cleavage system aminomethyltransferase GcvT [unclassified Chelatococcus]ALA18167.1 glycine cleavage system protein T [Chelatococcus sp. CO-6]